MASGTGASLAVGAAGAEVRCWEAALSFGWGAASTLNSFRNLEQTFSCVCVRVPHL